MSRKLPENKVVGTFSYFSSCSFPIFWRRPKPIVFLFSFPSSGRRRPKNQVLAGGMVANFDMVPRKYRSETPLAGGVLHLKCVHARGRGIALSLLVLRHTRSPIAWDMLLPDVLHTGKIHSYTSTRSPERDYGGKITGTNDFAYLCQEIISAEHVS